MLDFLGIGAQKCGTTWLYEQLRSHPQLAFPAGKEVHFWDRPFDDAAIAAYGASFTAGEGTRCGEITPAYAILPPSVITVIHRHYPALRLLYILRDPRERAWSSALMALRRVEMTIDEASDAWFIDHFLSQGSQRRGDYETCLRHWLSVYDRRQLLLLDYEDIARNPLVLLHRCADHLGVERESFSALPADRLKNRIYAGTGEPLRDSLKPFLDTMYAEKITRLRQFLETA